MKNVNVTFSNILKKIGFFVCFSFFTSTVFAANITYNFVGTLDEAFGTYATGTPFSGSLTYDSADPEQQPFTGTPPDSAQRGNHSFLSVTLKIGSDNVSNNGPGRINIYDKSFYPTDLFSLYTTSPTGVVGGLTLATGNGLLVVFQDVIGNAINMAGGNAGLPSGNLTLADFTSGNATFIQLQDAGNNITTRGTITALTTQGLPGVELCNGIDDDSDGLIDEGFPDTDADGIANCVDTSPLGMCGTAVVTIRGTAGDDRLVGTAGVDVISSLAGNDTVYGGGGNDVICAGAGNDVVFGEAGVDLIYGGNGNDSIDGGAGNDNLRGENGNDTIYGGTQNDTLNGGANQDVCDGGSPNLPGDTATTCEAVVNVP